jgi:hypothetical protein
MFDRPCFRSVGTDQHIYARDQSGYRHSHFLLTQGLPTPAVTGAPYSADQVTESGQTLADGTHVTKPTNVRHFIQDSQGDTLAGPFEVEPSVASCIPVKRKHCQDIQQAIQLARPSRRIPERSEPNSSSSTTIAGIAKSLGRVCSTLCFNWTIPLSAWIRALVSSANTRVPPAAHRRRGWFASRLGQGSRHLSNSQIAR